MKKLTLALAGASVAVTGLAATPASAADFRRHYRGRYEQVQTRRVVTNRYLMNNNRFQAPTLANRDGGGLAATITLPE